MNSEQIYIAFVSFVISSSFWMGFFSVFIDKAKESEKQKVQKIFKIRK
jgi:hypothetical protein